jgi:chromosome segregation ATPase
LAVAQNDLKLARQCLDSDIERVGFEKKKEVLIRIFSRPLRQDQEAVSAAFSKWVRSTLFDMDKEHKRTTENEQILHLTRQLESANQTNYQLEEARTALLLKEQSLVASHADLKAEVDASRAAESRVRQELGLVQDDLLTVRQSLESLEQEKSVLIAKLEALEMSLSTGAGNGDWMGHDFDERLRRMEKLIAQREAELQEKDTSIGERETTLKLRQREFTIQFEETDARIKETTNLLRQKELDLEFKETQLAAELAKCKDTQTRLQKLALDVQAKAQKLSQEQAVLSTRLKECDELESQLSEWQKRLESFKSNGLASKQKL